MLRQQGMGPLLHQVLRQHLGAKDVMLAQLGQPFKILDAQAQIVELPAREIQHPQGQAR